MRCVRTLLISVAMGKVYVWPTLPSSQQQSYTPFKVHYTYVTVCIGKFPQIGE